MPWQTVLATLNTQDPRHRCSTGLLDSPFLCVTTCELNPIPPTKSGEASPPRQPSKGQMYDSVATSDEAHSTPRSEQTRGLGCRASKLRPSHDSACRPMVARSSAQDSAQTPGLCDDVGRTLHHPSTPRVAHGKHRSLANDATNPPRLSIDDDDDKDKRAM